MTGVMSTHEVTLRGCIEEALQFAEKRIKSDPHDDLVIDIASDMRAALELLDAQTPPAPIPVRLECPACGELHIDEGEFATKPHHTHACQSCGAVWRPAVVPTVGVRFLPGFKDEPRPEPAPDECRGDARPRTCSRGTYGCEAEHRSEPEKVGGA